MIDRYLQKIEQIGMLRMIGIMIVYLVAMIALSYSYRFVFADRYYSPQNNLVHQLPNDSVSTLK